MASCTHPKYVAGCPDCRARSAASKRQERKRRREGTGHPDVAAETVREHIRELCAGGMSYTVIAEASGISRNTVERIGRGQRGRVHANTADAILTVTGQRRKRIDSIPAVGTARRIQALCVLGWSIVEQARRVRTSPSAVWVIAHGRQPAVSPGFAARVAAVYDEMYAVDPAPSQYVRATQKTAAKYGWRGHEAWTDATIDDPDAQPLELAPEALDEVAVQRAIAGDRVAVAALNRAERLEAARLLVCRGDGVSAVSRHLRVSGFTASRLIGKVRAGEVAA